VRRSAGSWRPPFRTRVAEESFALTPEQEQALRLAIAEAERGEGVEAEAFLDQITLHT
jgi:hypothetical protein